MSDRLHDIVWHALWEKDCAHCDELADVVTEALRSGLVALSTEEIEAAAKALATARLGANHTTPERRFAQARAALVASRSVLLAGSAKVGKE